MPRTPKPSRAGRLLTLTLRYEHCVAEALPACLQDSCSHSVLMLFIVMQIKWEKKQAGTQRGTGIAFELLEGTFRCLCAMLNWSLPPYMMNRSLRCISVTSFISGSHKVAAQGPAVPATSAKVLPAGLLVWVGCMMLYHMRAGQPECSCCCHKRHQLLAPACCTLLQQETRTSEAGLPFIALARPLCLQ